MNVCIVGYGMMGERHSEALKDTGAVLHTLVGRRADATQEFAKHYGYKKWTTNFEEALADPDVDIVILANPSDQHVGTALASLQAGKQTLVEIPLAMNLADGEKIVQTARERGLTLGVVYPMRMRSEMVALKERVLAGQEHIRQVCGRFYIYRLENVGATGYRRSWTDNLLWHHTSHLVDFGLWLLDAPVRRVTGFMPSLDPHTGIPMDVFVGVETGCDQSLITTGSYYGHEKLFETMVITDRDSYRIESFSSIMTTGAGAQPVLSERENSMLVARDFVQAVRAGHLPAVTGEAVLPSLRVLQQVQDQWDAVHGVRSIPGRELMEKQS